MTNKFTKISSRGFTLIELLVVIAIIGILSSVVLASLNTARAKGSDAALKAALSGVRAQAEIIYDDQKCYGDGSGATCTQQALGVCPLTAAAATDEGLFDNATILNQIVNAQGNSYSSTVGACGSSVGGTAWAVAMITKTAVANTANSGFCVDSTGKAKSITVATLDQAGIAAEINANFACAE